MKVTDNWGMHRNRVPETSDGVGMGAAGPGGCGLFWRRWGRRRRAWRCPAAWWTRPARRASPRSRRATGRRCRPGRTPSGASSGAWARARRARDSRSSTRRPSSLKVRPWGCPALRQSDGSGMASWAAHLRLLALLLPFGDGCGTHGHGHVHACMSQACCCRVMWSCHAPAHAQR